MTDPPVALDLTGGKCKFLSVSSAVHLRYFVHFSKAHVLLLCVILLGFFNSNRRTWECVMWNFFLVSIFVIDYDWGFFTCYAFADYH